MKTFRDDFFADYKLIIGEAMSKFDAAREEYKDTDITETQENLDNRDLIEDMIQEYIDIINYAVSQIIKLRRNRAKGR